MLKETITYTDYNDNVRTETFHFNLTKAEILEMEMSVHGGLTAMLQKIIDTQDQPALIKFFKDLILRAYGEKSPDGRQFIKSEALSTAFSQTEAYSQLYMKLATDDKAAAAFVNGVVPADMSKQS